MDARQHALAAEVRAEMGAQQVKPKTMQEQVGISSSAWHNYFVACVRDVPHSVVLNVAEALGMSASELLARAEARAERLSADPEAIAEDALSQLPAETQEAIRAVAADLRPKRSTKPRKRAVNGPEGD